MGENRDIPGRLAVRSPMQWSSAPDAGFSTAPPGDLCRPITDAPGFDAAAVNVMDQRRDEGSLLNWFERLIRRRRESPEIGHGRYVRLPSGDPAVLAHRCDWEGRSILAVHNLAGRTARADLAGSGDHPIERVTDLFGTRDLVADADGGLTVDLEPYGHRWFSVEHADVVPVPTGAKELYEEAKRLNIPGRSKMSTKQLKAAIARGR
jgi:maltose alpha-D-glucosyltransferase/alpha-amylase